MRNTQGIYLLLLPWAPRFRLEVFAVPLQHGKLSERSVGVEVCEEDRFQDLGPGPAAGSCC